MLFRSSGFITGSCCDHWIKIVRSISNDTGWKCLSILSPPPIFNRTAANLLSLREPRCRVGKAAAGGAHLSATPLSSSSRLRVTVAELRQGVDDPRNCYQLLDFVGQNGHLTTPRSFPTVLEAWFSIKTLLLLSPPLLSKRGKLHSCFPVKLFFLSPFLSISIRA